MRRVLARGLIAHGLLTDPSIPTGFIGIGRDEEMPQSLTDGAFRDFAVLAETAPAHPTLPASETKYGYPCRLQNTLY